jgi:hypothetical protein
VEFGLTLKADSGVIITKVGAEANFKISHIIAAEKLQVRGYPKPEKV